MQRSPAAANTQSITSKPIKTAKVRRRNVNAVSKKVSDTDTDTDFIKCISLFLVFHFHVLSWITVSHIVHEIFLNETYISNYTL